MNFYRATHKPLFTLQRDTNRDLEWFKCIKKTHGEVQPTALQQAVDINDRGYYRLGNIKRRDIRQGGKLVSGLLKCDT